MHSSRKKSAGISILEMMVVLGIMALIIGVAAPRAIGYLDRAKIQTADMQRQQLKGALQLLYVDAGRFPTEGEGLDSLTTQPATMPGWKGPYILDADALVDPWGRAFEYQVVSEAPGYRIVSFGRDGQPGGDGQDADLLD